MEALTTSWFDKLTMTVLEHRHPKPVEGGQERF
jgi:hypothetical protein